MQSQPGHQHRPDHPDTNIPCDTPDSIRFLGRIHSLAAMSSSSADEIWMKKCRPETMPIPPFDRFIYMLPEHVVKKRLVPGELGFDGYEPDYSTIASRDENEVRVLELVRQYTNIPVPKLIHQGDG